MTKLNIGIIGGGYMGKAHASAMASVGTVFETKIKPNLYSVCGSTPQSSQHYRDAYGFEKAADTWHDLVNDPKVDAIVIASPQTTHRAIAEAAFALGKPVLCEKPLGASLQDATAMAKAAQTSQCINMIGFNYMKTPATQHALKMVKDGVLGTVFSFRAEHTEDFLSDPNTPSNWRCFGRENGNMGDLTPHIVNVALSFMGPVVEVMAHIEQIYKTRPSPDGPVAVENDDQATLMCKFANGASGTLFSSRVSTGNKMGIRYEITGTKGALRFDQEDQNCLMYYNIEDNSSERGFRRILAGPQHPDYMNFCQGPGHGTGYLDQIIMEDAAFIRAIETDSPARPNFQDGLDVSILIDAAWRSNEDKTWVAVAPTQKG